MSPAVAIEPQYLVDDDTGCWEWQLYRNEHGYGRITRNRKTQYAHRWIYEQEREQIPDGMQIDHLCRNRACVNPDHLEVVDSRTNTLRGEAVAGRNARKTHCIRGHEFTPENTLIITKHRHPARVCRECRRLQRREA